MACGDEGPGRYVPGRPRHVAALSQRAPVCVGSTRRTGLHGGLGSEPVFRPGLCVIRAKEPLLSGARPGPRPPPPPPGGAHPGGGGGGGKREQTGK